MDRKLIEKVGALCNAALRNAHAKEVKDLAAEVVSLLEETPDSGLISPAQVLVRVQKRAYVVSGVMWERIVTNIAQSVTVEGVVFNFEFHPSCINTLREHGMSYRHAVMCVCDILGGLGVSQSVRDGILQEYMRSDTCNVRLKYPIEEVIQDKVREKLAKTKEIGGLSGMEPR